MARGVLTLPLPGPPYPSQRPGGPRRQPTPPLPEFVAGPENHLAIAAVAGLFKHDGSPAAAPSGAANRTANSPPAAPTACPQSALFNPLVLYGPPATGKTHLAHALAHEWGRLHPDQRAVYVTAAALAGELSDAIETDGTLAWRRRYREASLLVIDDLAQLAAKPPAQSELLHTIDAVLARGGLLVVTCRSDPRRIARLSPALVGRLTGGLFVPLTLPGTAARLELLRMFVHALRLDVADETLHALADCLSASAPQLCEALLQLDHQARTRRRAIQPSDVRQALKSGTPRQPITLRTVTARAARYFGLKPSDLRGPSRRRALVAARDVAMYVARQLTGGSLEQIGRYFGGRDHTTVLHGCRKVAELLKSDASVREAVEHLQQTT